MRNWFSLNLIYLILIAAQSAAIIFLCIWLPVAVPVASAVAIVWTLNIIASICVYFKGASPEISLSLILFIIALPVFGALIYFFSLARRTQKAVLTSQPDKPEFGEAAILYNLCKTTTSRCDRAVYFSDGEQFFNMLFQQISNAKKYVYLEFFIIRRGEIFSRLLSAIREAKSNGAKILLLADGVGSAFKMGRKEIKLARAAGAEVRIFHKILPLFYFGLNNRDHRKIAVIDGRAAFTGGFNIGDEYANIHSPFGHWKDNGVAVFGDGAKMFEAMFLSIWDKDIPAPDAGEGNESFIPFYDSPPYLTGVAENLFAAAICSAKQRVHIFTPYFCTGEKICDALRLACLRGVDVRVIIPHIPDKKYAFELTRACAEKLIDCGIKFYEYTPGFLHAKGMICDDKAYLGTYNFDFRSMRLNFECGAIFQGEVAQKAERDFWDTMRLSQPFLPPAKNAARSVYRFFLKLFAPLF